MARTIATDRTPSTKFSAGRTGQQGFAFINLLFLIPAAMMLMSGIVLMALTLRNYNLTTAGCRRAVWLAQTDMGKTLTQMLRLNPEARRLRLQRKIVETELKAAIAAVQPVLVTALEAELTMVTAQQIRLRQQQQRLLIQAGLRRAAARGDFTRQQTQVPVWQVTNSSLSKNLAVNFIPPFDLSPDTVVSPNFEKLQKLTLNWQTNLLAQAPTNLMDTLNIKPLIFKGRCSASLEQEGLKWRPQLVADKF